MSFNLIDFTIFEKLDCSAESAHKKIFAQRQCYEITNLETTDSFSFDILLNHENSEANDPKYAEVVVQKRCSVGIKKIYGSDLKEKFFCALESAIGQYYIVDWISKESIRLTAKEKGSVPSLQTPALKFEGLNGISFQFQTVVSGKDTSVHVPKSKRNIVHLPRSTFGINYKVPEVGDRLIFVDSVDPARDRTFTREIIDVKQNAPCTCDVLILDTDIDRLESNEIRIDGIGLQKPHHQLNNYTASFDKVSVFRRRRNFREILDSRANPTGACALPIGNYANMKEVGQRITKQFFAKSRDIHFNGKQEYFGGLFHWTEFKDDLLPIYSEFGQFLVDHLFILTSGLQRPEYLVHIDYDEEQKNLPVTGSFTWPVLNCDPSTLTVWYECRLQNEKIYNYGRQQSVITNSKIEMNEIDRYKFDTGKFNAVIFRHDQWHTLYNDSDSADPRVLLQWRFKPELSWIQIQEITQKILQSC